MDGEQQSQRRQSQNPDAAVADVEPRPDQPSLCPEPNLESDGLGSSRSKSSFNHKDIVKALDVLERDSVAIAQSFSSLFASLRLALSEVTSVSVDHMQCFGDAAGRLQESVFMGPSCPRSWLSSWDFLHACELWFTPSGFHSVESVLDAATKGNRYINSCLRLNEEMKGVDSLASQLKMLRRNVDSLDAAVNKLLPPP